MAGTRGLMFSCAILLVCVNLNGHVTCGYELKFDPESKPQAQQQLQQCGFSPAVWCSSVEIARRCQVEDACHRNVWTQHVAAPPVQFALYYETLCSDCKQFMHEQLWPAYKKIASIISFQLAPYGNAREYKKSGKWVFECQHEEPECIGNTIQTCAIHLLQNASMYMPFVNCMEASELLPAKSAPQCAHQLSVDYSAINRCALGSLGNRLQHDVAVKTDALHPPHTFVPWITLNGVHTDKIQEAAEDDLIKLICDTYMGEKPSGCYDNRPPPLTHSCVRN